MKIFIVIVTLAVLVVSSEAQQISKKVSSELVEVELKFVAFDKFYGWGDSQKPSQTMIAEIQKENLSAFREVIKVIYFPKTTGFPGGENFLEGETLSYNNSWKTKIRQPSYREKPYCDANNFLESSDDIRANKRGEPTLIFHSTQFDADIKFNNLSEMRCMILESFSE